MSNEIRRTPGPWRIGHIDLDHRSGSIEIKAEAGPHVAYANTCYSNRHQVEGNARLIAAAPDLLAACEAAFGMAQEWADHRLDDDTPDAALGRQLRAAIAKARGLEGGDA